MYPIETYLYVLLTYVLLYSVVYLIYKKFKKRIADSAGADNASG